jgi:hypothetical protein
VPGVYIPPHHADQPKGKQTQVGIWWPAADSAKLRTAAQAWREMAHTLDAVDAATQPAVLNLLADNQGPAMDAFAAYWQKWSGAKGYLPTCSQACNAMAKALDEYAQAVDDARVKVEELVAEIGTAVVLGVVLGICTVGIATAAAGAVSVSLVASAELVGIGLTQTAGLIIGGMVVGASFGAVEAMAIDIVAIQPEKILLFHDQKDFNWNEVWQWGEMGAVGGFVGGGLSASIGAAGDALPSAFSDAMATRLGRVIVGGTSGAATSATLDELEYGQINPLDVVAGAVGGAAGGGIRVRPGGPTLQPFDDLASIRVRDGVPAVGDPGGDAFTRSRLDVGGQPFYGKNAPDTVQDPPPSVTYQTMRHAEGDAVAQAVAAGKTGGEADLYVDRQPCGFCRSSLAGLAKWAHFDVMRVWTPDGLYGTYSVETGKLILANQL